MASKKSKKKAPAKKKKSEAEAVKERSVFWPIAWGVVLCIVAVLLMLGGFNYGGTLPVSMFKGVYWALGWAGYLAPVALMFFAIIKFRHEERRVPLPKLLTMTTFVLAVSALMHTLFVSVPDPAASVPTTPEEGNGGAIGELIGGALLSALDKIPASLVFFIIAFIMFFLAFGISFKVLLKVFSGLKKEKSEDTDLQDLKEKHFKLNEGVPMVHEEDEVGGGKKPRLHSFKNSAPKLTAKQNHEALTTTSDAEWIFPSIELLNQKQDKANAGDVEGNAQAIKETFNNFNIDVEMEGANVGPRVTQYTLRPPTGVKLTKITALENNLALDLAAHSIRMEAPIPGKRLVGIEVPNIKSATVRVSSLLQSSEWQALSRTPLGFVIGKDIAGNPVVGDLAKMPHLLVAGQTGSGKSVMVNTILTSLLYHNTPADLKLILVDPKTVELTPYDEIPHLLTPVITEPEKCISALKWAVAEMERRYRTLAEVKKRNIAEYNNLKKEEGMPYIVIVIDELADLMMMAARDVEALIVRIAQKARAVGIHLILATQRPSVDVITGLIKANVPARIAFTTSSQVDSRTIIDQIGAEKLLGRGDMLFKTSEMPQPIRVQGALIDDDETNKVTDFIRDQRAPMYDDEVVSQPVQFNGRGGIVAETSSANEADDDMWEDAVRVVIEGRKASTSLLQRRLRVGYSRAARLIETMEEQGIVGPADGSKPREVLVSSMDQVFGGSSAGADLDDGYTDPMIVHGESNRDNYLTK